MNLKLKVVRVVTAANVVDWHMKNTLQRFNNDTTVDITVIGDNVDHYKEVYSNIRFINLPIARKIDLKKDLLALYKLTKLLHKLKPDIVHSIMPKAGLITSLAGFFSRTNVRIHTYTGQVWNLSNKPIFNGLYWLDRLINCLNTHSLTDSPSQSLFLYDNGFKKSNCVIPHLGSGSLSGVDKNLINADSKNVKMLNKSLSLDGKFVYTYLARKTIDKGAVDLLRAYSLARTEINNTVLLFIGPDESNGYLEELKNAEPNLFHSVIEIDAVPNYFDYLALSNILCLPSYREGFGSIVIDAAVFSVPCIGTDIVGLKDAISDRNTGILTSTGDIHGISNAMKELFNNRALYLQMSENAKSRVNSMFGADLLHTELMSFYHKALNSARKV